MDMYSRYSGSDDVIAGLPGTGFVSFVFGMLGFLIILSLVFYVVFAFFGGMMFKKAGRTSWHAYVPILNSWIVFEMAGIAGWMLLIPIVGPFFFYYALYKVGKNFELSTLQTIGLVLFPFIFYTYIALNKNITWHGGHYKTFGNNDGNNSSQNNQQYSNNVQQPYVITPVQPVNNMNVQQPYVSTPVQPVNNMNVQQSYVSVPVEPVNNMNVQQPYVSAPVEPVNNMNVQQPYVSAPVEQTDGKVCPSCGTKVSTSSEVCFLCGHRF